MTDLYEELDFLDGIRDKVAILGNLMERFEASDILISDLKEINENLAELELMLRRKHIMSDGKEAKFVFIDDLSQPPIEKDKVSDFEKIKGIGKQWYEHCVGRSHLTVLGGTVMSKGDLDKLTKKEKTDD